jgi:hypothetical protein
MPDRCDRCHRNLTDPESQRLGRGPVCRAREPLGEAPEQGMLPTVLETAGRRAGAAVAARSWTFVEEPGFVVVTDLGTGRSVTNDAAAVLLELGRETGLEGKRVIYRDTDGRWDELLHEGVHFRGFAPIGATGTYRDAITAASRSAP